MGYKIITKKRFANHLLKVLIYLEKEWGKQVADEFLDRIYTVMNMLKTHPFIGAPSKKIPGVRGLFVTKHNRLFYRIENKNVILISLADTRKKSYD